MKVNVSRFALAAAILAGTSASGIAGGDWSDAGIKDYSASIPVPAPIPVAINAAQWYLRGDIGWVGSASGDVTATGYPVDTFEFGGGDSSFSVGFGVGYYLTPSWRVELAGDWSSESTTSRATEGIPDTTIDIVGPPSNGDTSIDTLHYSGDFNHKTTLHSTAALVNLIYDLDTGSWFKPYIGGGLGLSVHRLRVVGDSTLQCSTFDRTYTDDTVLPAPPLDLVGQPCSAADLATRNSNTITAYGLAANLMAGVGIEVYDGVHWDTGYRFMYRGGTPSINFHTPTSEGTVEVDSRIDHELRTGLRFDIF